MQGLLVLNICRIWCVKSFPLCGRFPLIWVLEGDIKKVLSDIGFSELLGLVEGQATSLAKIDQVPFHAEKIRRHREEIKKDH